MQDVIGRPPVHPAMMIVGKIGFITSWAFLALRVAGIDLLGVAVEPARVPALVLAVAGLLIVMAALLGLGAAARVGLPTEEERIRLRTTGPYAFSRNPVYVGGLVVCVASCLYVPHWLNVAATLAAALVHHRIVLAEERFLAGRFGGEWVAYRSRVRRYF